VDAHSSLDNGVSINIVTSLPHFLTSGGERVAQVVCLINFPSWIIVLVNIPAKTAITRRIAVLLLFVIITWLDNLRMRFQISSVLPYLETLPGSSHYPRIMKKNPNSVFAD